MSIWYEIKDQEDVSVDDQGKWIDICFKTDSQGNHYVTVPIEFVKKAIAESEVNT